MPFFSSVEPSAVPFFFSTSSMDLCANFMKFAMQVRNNLRAHEGIDADTVVSSSDDSTTCVWDVAMARWRPSVKAQLPTSSPLPQAAARSRPTQDVLTTRGDLVLVHLTYGVTEGCADVRGTGGCADTRVCQRPHRGGLPER